MDLVDNALEEFIELFQGSNSYFGVSKPTGKKNSKGKAEYKHWLEPTPMTKEHWRQHLKGEAYYGSVPIRDDNTCSWGVIDVDRYNIQHQEVISTIRKRKYPLVPFRSKSNGLHLILFIEGVVPAFSMRKKLIEIASDLGINDTTTDIFPAQDEVDLTPDNWDEKRKGNPINLGTGFIPRSVDLKQTQVYLDEIRRGTPTNEAMSKARDVYGLPITQLFDLREDRYKYTTKSGEKINISPGRVVAAQVQEPGSMGYNVLSGIIDGVFRLAADPTNLALAYGAGVKTAMRGMVQSSQQVKLAKDGASLTIKTLANTFKLGEKGKKARLAFYGRTIDDVRKTGWGQKFGQALADLKGDEGMSFLMDIPEFKNIHPSFKEVIIQLDNADDVWNVLEMVAKGGNLTQKNFDDVFTMLKTKLPEKAAELDRIRNLTLDNINFGLDVLPAKPTVTGEMFNYMGKLMTGQATDVAPLRKLTGSLLSRDNPAKKLLGMGTQLSKAILPRHVQRAMQLRPETVMVIGDLGAAANNADDMLKLSFADANTRGKFVREVLAAENQDELNQITHRINQAIAKSVVKENPMLKIDVEDLLKQQEAYVAELDELRSLIKNASKQIFLKRENKILKISLE